MSQEEINKQNEEHNKVVQEVIDKVKNKESNFYFYCPPMNIPSGGMGVLFRLVRILKDENFDVKIIYEPRPNQRASFEKSSKLGRNYQIYENFKPTWTNIDLSDVEFVPLGDGEMEFDNGEKIKASPLNLRPEDFLMIPEGFPDVMKKTVQSPCKRIVIAQSWFYILNGLNSGEKWQNFGIKDVVSVSDAITEYLTAIMPGLQIKQFSQSIDRSTFKPPTKKSGKYPMIAFSCSRGQENRMKTYNIIKTFQAFYPHLKWIRFIELANMSKEDFAERLASCAFYLYTDDIAGFGTSPLESMACGTHVIGWNAFGGKEYVNQENGFWTVNGDIFQTAEIMGLAVDKWLNGEMDIPEIQTSYEKTLSRYTESKEKETFLKIINEYQNERINELEGIKKK